MTVELEQLKCKVEEMLVMDDLDVDLPMSQLGVDSLNIIEIATICQEVYPNINDKDIDIDGSTTLRQINKQMLMLSLQNEEAS